MLWAPVVLCGIEGRKRQRMSLRADILRERHSSDSLAAIVDAAAFMEADYFLFLRAELPPESVDAWTRWIPESALFLKQPPRYLVAARRVDVARRLAAALGLDGPDMLGDRLRERHAHLTRGFPATFRPPNPFQDRFEVINNLGTRPT